MGYDKSIPSNIVKEIFDEAIRMVPKIKELKMVDKWSGLRPYSEDEKPVLGFAPNYKNFIIATGHFKNGFLLAPITGKLVSELIADGRTSLKIDELSPKR